MDLHLKQWRNHQHESEQQHSAKTPKLLFDDPQHQPSSVLPLFVPEPNTKISNLSATLPDSSSRFLRMGSFFSLAQWQELELQALIYRYMSAGAAVPPELLLPIKKSLSLQSSPLFLHHYNYQPALMQSGYWSRATMDPEPGRCRRTDGKKWRCSRDVVAGHKYCERHIHRGRNRSRKPVEMPTSNVTTNNVATTFGGSVRSGGHSGALKATANVAQPSDVANGPQFGLSRPSPYIDLLHLNQSCSDSKTEHKGFYEVQNEADNRNNGRILRSFFDDWPRAVEESDNGNSINSTSLSMSMSGNNSSDVSLKLSTGIGDELGHRGNEREQQPQLNWTAGWPPNHAASMGGPLAEALRSAGSSPSPTSVLHQLPRISAPETSYVSG